MRLAATTPRELVSDSTIVALDGTVTLLLASAPVSGNAWDLRRLVVADADELFHVHCDAIACVATPVLVHETPTPADAVDFAVAVPLALHWSRGTVILLPGERVTVWVSGAIPGRSLVAAAQVEESFDPRFT